MHVPMICAEHIDIKPPTAGVQLVGHTSKS